MIGFYYNWIEASWLVSVIVVKYALIGFFGYKLITRSDLESIKEDFSQYGRYLVIFIVLSGLTVLSADIPIEPMIPVIGEFTALAFYAYLFWEY